MINQKNIDKLEKLTTRQLLKWLTLARKCKYGYDPTCCGGMFYTVDELKQVLATRPHVPNKLEAQKIRKQKAQTKRNR